nr:glycoside hydrolase [Paenibacillus tyrfis]
MKKKIIIWSVAAAMAVSILAGCEREEEQERISSTSASTVERKDFTFDINPATFDLTIEQDGVREQAAAPMPESKVTELKREADKVEWTYPERKMKVALEKKPGYLDITLQSTGAERFQWPKVSADSYILPLWEGKFVPGRDANWKTFLQDETMTWSESFSMNFFALNKKHYSFVYILKQPFNHEVHFDTKDDIQFQLDHEFPSVNPDRTYGFRLYVADSDPVQIAGLYKSVLEEKSAIVTLAQKAKANPEIEKLYGAPHIYLWNNDLLTPEEINWPQWRAGLKSPLYPWVSKLLAQYTEDGSKEFDTVFKQVSAQDHVEKYQKSVIVRALNQVLKMKELYNADVFQPSDAVARQLIQQGVAALSEQKLYQLNKMLLKSVLLDAVGPIEDWGKANSTDIVREMSQLGIKKAWIGLPNWINGLMNPKFVEQADQAGYLVAPYDSYHSIHDKENRDWNTAYFGDGPLYEQATITNKKGEKVKGFLGRGRKLNPTLALPLVKQRVQSIMQDGISYRSWFVDADATGEIYDDYSPGHPTTQEQDMKARLERMAYIANEKKMVVGSETGNDFASGVIAFAHGLETPVIKWGDPDMRVNKSSEYYVGGYYSTQGGIPERYRKQVPVKELYKRIYIDPAYSLPLYKLVYNDSVITTHHWEWGSFKIKDAVVERMMTEFLYNVPPLYHLDQQQWAKDKQTIAAYLKEWAPFHQQAVTRPMTGFRILTPDRLVQSTAFGSDLKVIANYSAADYRDEQGTVIKPRTVVIYEGGHGKAIDLSAIMKAS